MSRMHFLSIVFIASAAGVAPTVPVTVLYHSADDDAKRGASMSLTEYYDKKASESSHESSKRRVRTPSTVVRKATEIMTQVYLANPNARTLWELCEEALRENNIVIRRESGENILTSIRKPHGTARRYQVIPRVQKNDLERLYGLGLTKVDDLDRGLRMKFGEDCVTAESIRHWLRNKAQVARLRSYMDS